MPVPDDRVVGAVILRTCRKCKTELCLVDFERAKNVKHGRLYVCKLCRSTRPGRNVRFAERKPMTKEQRERYNAQQRANYLRRQYAKPWGGAKR